MVLKTLLKPILENFQLTADQILILETIGQKDSVFLEEIFKIEKQRSILLQNLARRGYLGVYDENIELSFDNIYLTDKGENVIVTLKKELDNIKDTNIEFKPNYYEEKFQEFWNTFPSSDKYLHFPRSRVLKTELDKCRKMYRKLLDEYKHEDIMNALNYEIKMRESNSISSMNKTFSDFKYMKASSTWLNNKEFLSIQEIMNDDNIEKIDEFSKDV